MNFVKSSEYEALNAAYAALKTKHDALLASIADRDHAFDKMKAQRNDLDAKNHVLTSAMMQMIDRWWPFVHGSTMPSKEAARLLKVAQDALTANGNVAKNALLAQLTLQAKLWKAAQADIQKLFEIQPINPEDGSYQVDGQSCHEFYAAMNFTPIECLNEIRAEAGRAGFIACYHQDRFILILDEVHLNWRADQYAETIRNGGEA